MIQKNITFANALQTGKMKRFILFTLFALTVYSFNSYSQTADQFFSKGMEKLKAMELDSANYYFNKALESDPKYSDAAFRRGFVKDKQGDLQGAYEDYTLAISIAAKPVYLNNRGMIKFVTGDFNEAIIDFDNAIALDSNYLIALFNKGRAFVELKETDKGCVFMREAFDKGLTIVEDALDFYCN